MRVLLEVLRVTALPSVSRSFLPQRCYWVDPLSAKSREIG